MNKLHISHEWTQEERAQLIRMIASATVQLSYQAAEEHRPLTAYEVAIFQDHMGMIDSLSSGSAISLNMDRFQFKDFISNPRS